VAGFDDHLSSPPVDDETEEVATRNARRGMILFLIYLVVYGAYVGLNAFKPAVMDAIPLLGINLAVLYGVGLIVLAMVLALVYAWLCRATRNGASTAHDKEPSR